MPNPSDRRKLSVIDFIVIITVILLIYALYLLFGGDWNILYRLGSKSGGESVLDQIIGNLNALGQGIGNAFSDMFR